MSNFIYDPNEQVDLECICKEAEIIRNKLESRWREATQPNADARLDKLELRVQELDDLVTGSASDYTKSLHAKTAVNKDLWEQTTSLYISIRDELAVVRTEHKQLWEEIHKLKQAVA